MFWDGPNRPGLDTSSAGHGLRCPRIELVVLDTDLACHIWTVNGLLCPAPGLASGELGQGMGRIRAGLAMDCAGLTMGDLDLPRLGLGWPWGGLGLPWARWKVVLACSGLVSAYRGLGSTRLSLDFGWARRGLGVGCLEVDSVVLVVGWAGLGLVWYRAGLAFSWAARGLATGLPGHG
jgi:hypothetical protein